MLSYHINRDPDGSITVVETGADGSRQVDPHQADYVSWLAQGNIPEVINSPPLVPPSLDEIRVARCAAVNSERDRHVYSGCLIHFPDGPARIQARSEQDWINIIGIGTAGLEAIVSGIAPNTAITGLGFKDEANSWHPLTPGQAVDFGKQAKAYRAAVYETSWAHKDAINAMIDPEAILAYDITAGWPA